MIPTRPLRPFLRRSPPAATRGRLRRTGLILLLLGVLLPALLAALAVQAWQHEALPLAAERVELRIEPGSSPQQVARAWAEAGVELPARLLYEGFRWSGEAGRIRAGSYAIARGTTGAELLGKMVRGEEELATVRIGEGWTVRQMRAALAAAEALRPDTAALDEAALMAALGAPGQPAEGRFFPDTYPYSRGSADLDVLRRAYHAMQQALAEAWAARAPDLPLRSADEALILASIVEKETGRPEDRGRVAGVFVNRLRIGMRLQTDPTVIYGLGPAFDGNLRRRDLETDTPWNTYTRAGLPPTPIALPGREALRAAVQPEATPALYFVARGDGSSEFSADLDAHNRAVRRFQLAPAASRPASIPPASSAPRP